MSTDENRNTISYHDASYDAASTGFIFLKLLGYINRCEKSLKLDLSARANEKISHKLSVTRSDIIYLNLIGDDGRLGYSPFIS